MIPVETWLPIIDPFSGCENGQIHVLLAVGTQEQIDNLLTLQNLKCTIDVDNNTIMNAADQSRKNGIIECKEIMKDNLCVDLTGTIDSFNNLRVPVLSCFLTITLKVE